MFPQICPAEELKPFSQWAGRIPGVGVWDPDTDGALSVLQRPQCHPAPCRQPPEVSAHYTTLLCTTHHLRLLFWADFNLHIIRFVAVVVADLKEKICACPFCCCQNGLSFCNQPNFSKCTNVPCRSFEKHRTT